MVFVSVPLEYLKKSFKEHQKYQLDMNIASKKKLL